MNLPQPTNRIDWLKAYLEVENMNEHFENVHIITLKSDICDGALLDAIESLVHAGEDISQVTDAQLNAIVLQLITDQKVGSQERVIVDEYGIEVCIDCETTEDPAALSRALDMVADALDQLNGQKGMILFGEQKTYSLAEIPWLATP